jgi:hypothetical protein
MLSAKPTVVGIHEPDHLDVVGIGDGGMHPYINERNETSAYYQMYARIFRGMMPVPFGPTKEYFAELWRRRGFLTPADQTLVVKSVFSLHNTEWIYRNFSPRVVILLRHPCSIIHSIHRKWPDARLKELHTQAEFVRDHLGAHQEILEHAESPFAMLASRIAAYYSAILRARRAHPSWIVVTHEQLCVDPLREIRRLYDELELAWDSKVEAAIKASNRPKESDRISHVNRLAAGEIGKWKALLSNSEIAEIARYFCPFGIPYYTDLCE